MLSCVFRMGRAIGPAVRRNDRVQFPPLGLRERDGEAVIDLIARLGQHSRHDARVEGSAVNADSCADLHALPLSIRKNSHHEALVAIDKGRQCVPCIDMPAGPSPDVQDVARSGNPHIGFGQGIQSLLLNVDETLVILQNRGKFLFLDFHSLFIEVDVAPFLNEGTDGDDRCLFPGHRAVRSFD